MKLLYITNQISGSGGLERVLSIKLSYFADKLGYEIHLASIEDDSQDHFFTFSPKIILHQMSLKGSLFGYLASYRKAINQLVDDVCPDIVVVCDDGLKGFFVPLMVKQKTKFIYERHVSKLASQANSDNGLISKLLASFKYFLMNIGGKKYDAFVVLTKGNLAEWKFNNLKIISNPLPYKPEAMSDLNEKRVIAVGKHCYQKGYDSLLRIWKKVSVDHPDWKLSIFGKYNAYHDLKSLSKEMKLEESVELSIPVKDIYKEFMSSSIHVLSSRYEGFGMVIIEAMSCGLPSVSYNCPHGPSDIINHGDNGFLVENGDEELFARSLSKLMSNIKLRKKLGYKAYSSVDKYSIDSISKQWQKLFEEVLN